MRHVLHGHSMLAPEKSVAVWNNGETVRAKLQKMLMPSEGKATM